MLIAGYETKGYQPYDFRLVQGRRIASGREVMVEQNWAREHGYGVGDRVPWPARPAAPSCRSSGSSSSRAASTSAGSAMRRCRSRRAAALRPAEGLDADLIVAEDRGDVGPLKKRVEHVRLRRPRPDPWRGVGPDLRPARRAQHRSLLLLGRGAVRRRLPDPEQLQHDGAPAHARARDAPHARRLAPHGDELGSDRGAGSRASSAPCSGSGSACFSPPG